MDYVEDDELFVTVKVREKYRLLNTQVSRKPRKLPRNQNIHHGHFQADLCHTLLNEHTMSIPAMN